MAIAWQRLGSPRLYWCKSFADPLSSVEAGRTTERDSEYDYESDNSYGVVGRRCIRFRHRPSCCRSIRRLWGLV